MKSQNNEEKEKLQVKPTPKKIEKDEKEEKESFYGKKERVAHVQKKAAPPKKVELAGTFISFELD